LQGEQPDEHGSQERSPARDTAWALLPLRFAKHEGCDELGKYNDPDGQPVCKGHYIEPDAESAAIERHLAICHLCNEDNEVLCKFYWTVGIEPD
jgi:hypothetical protein